ncbi:MAG: leucine-rich repeat protein [Solobacterium sp.]|nr:leucine-rich repeat protein [Solobacterium sp.]
MLKKGFALVLCLCLAACFATEVSQDSASEETVEEVTAVKPRLSIIGEEEQDYSRSMQNKIQVHDASEARLKTVKSMPVDEKDYTVMIYMVGSNLESRNGAATNDLREIEETDIDYSKNNVLVYAGGSRRWNSNISNMYNSVLDMGEDEEERLLAQTETTADMGAANTLAAFINYCTENYPAKHYGLICWNHGGGPVWGYGYDELFDNDSLLLQEMQDAMEETIFAEERKLDFVGFDACLMSTFEIANVWSNYADYMIGSQETEAGAGWDYHFLDVLNQTDDAGTIAAEIVDSFGKYYEENQTEFSHPDATLAALDLSYVNDTKNALDQLFEGMQNEVENGRYAEINRKRADAKGFGLNSVKDLNDSYDLIDIEDFCEQMSDLLPSETENVRKAIRSLVTVSSSNVENTGGISLYFPGDNQQLYSESQMVEHEISDQHEAFMNSYADSWNKSIEVDWHLGKGEFEGDEIILSLDESQFASASQAYYTILRYNLFSGYSYAMCNVQAKMDDEGRIHVPQDPDMIYAITDLSEADMPWAFKQSQATENGGTYTTLNALLSTGHEFTDFDPNTDKNVTITVQMDNDSEDTMIKDVVSQENAAGLSGKGSIDVSHFRTIIDGAFGSYEPSRYEDGTMKPFYEWHSGGYSYRPLGLESTFRFKKKKASQFDHDFVCQILIKDINGDIHASELVNLPKKDEIAVTETNTPQGKMTFQVFEDSVSLAKYEGSDESVDIPETVNGLPVKEIGMSAFYNLDTLVEVNVPSSVETICSLSFNSLKSLERINMMDGLKEIQNDAICSCPALKEISLPDTLTIIGREGINNTGIESLVLPASLEKIGDVPFSENSSLKEITIEDNDYYKTVDGILFTKDGSRLIQYPSMHGEEYEVPEGTKHIAYGAFAESPVTHVSFPETLQTIENCAFFDCTSLQDVVLPESLETIGERAFGKFTFLSSSNAEASAYELHLGKNVSYIGAKAFNGLWINSFTVDEENPVYANSGIFLTNRAKDTILEAPVGCERLIDVPDGITTLTKDIFEELGSHHEFIFPDSAFRFSDRIFDCSYETDDAGQTYYKYNVVLHCSEGSACEEYAQKYDIRYDYETDPAHLVYEEKEADGMVFRKYYDHAELTGCESEEEILRILDMVEDVPVTAIEDYSTSYFDDPFSASCKKLVLPATMEKVNIEVLHGFFFLQEIEIDGESEHLTVVDNVLFTKDKETLLFYPDYKTDESYTIPEGTKTIGREAFGLNSNITSLTFPSTLKTIEEDAMNSLYDLTEVHMNEGLEYIGNSAFGSTYFNIHLPETVKHIGQYAFYLKSDQPELVINDSIEYIGQSAFSCFDEGPFRFGSDTIQIGANTEVHYTAFSGLLYNSFTVDDANTKYSTNGELLMDKTGRKVILAASGLEGSVYIPEGVDSLDYGSFHNCKNVTDIYLPDSILDVSGAIKKYYNEDPSYHIRYHCRKDNDITKYLDSEGIEWIDDIK